MCDTNHLFQKITYVLHPSQVAFSTEKLKMLWQKNYDLLIIVIISEWVSDDGGILYLSNLIPMVAAVECETHTEF